MAVKVWEYGVPTIPEESVELVVIDSPETMARLKIFGTACWGVPLSVARIVKLNEPSAGGVPLSVPLAERLTPSGKEPAVNAQVYGGVPPVAAKVWE